MLLQLLLAASILVATRVLWRRWKYDLHKIPSPPGLPILGHTLKLAEFGKHSSKWFRERHRKLGYPKIIKLQFFSDNWVFVTDTECVRSEVANRTDPLPKHEMNKILLKPMISADDKKDTLIATNHKAYAQQLRKVYSVGLQTAQLKKAFPRLKSMVDELIRVIETRRQKGPIDFQRLCGEFTLDAIGAVAFETSLGGMDGSRNIYKGIMETGERARELMFNPLLNVYCKLFPNSAIAKETRKMTDGLTDEWSKLTQDILQRPDPPKDEMPIWYNLKRTIDPETKEHLPYEMLRSEVATVVVTGMDTTGNQISWILGMLAAHPEIVENILDELEEHNLYGPNRREIEIEDLASLSYLNAVIKEGFRVVHIVTGCFPRFLPRDMTISGYRLPKGTIVNFPGNRAVNTEKDWGDPDVVRPERWLTGEDMSSKYFHMFSLGPRDCIGQKLAMLEVRQTIVSLLTKYHLSTDKSFKELLENAENSGLIESKGGMWLNLSPREANNEMK